jgi:hypothetical protein
MAEKFSLPSKKGVVFWPVGTGDSTTLIIRPDELLMQIDLRHLEKADDPEEPEWPLIDHLVKVLPKKSGKPYLAVFALTHPDKDHIQGFSELLKKVHIGELWHTPKIFRDQGDDDEMMCEDARAFRKEAHRRREYIQEHPDDVPSGHRLRVIGHDDILEEDDYVDLPETAKSRPGEIVTLIDGEDMAGEFEAFLHAPFKDDQAANKNNTSLSMNVVLHEGDQSAQFFFFGDREYPTTKRIFEDTETYKNTPYLQWDVMLCSHHCSKGVMYWQDEGDEEEVLKQDILDFFGKYAKPGAVIVASAHSKFTDESGANPPHLKARKRYEEIVAAGNFICTHEYPSKAEPKPLIFVLDEKGLKLDDQRSKRSSTPAFGAAVKDARGSAQPPGLQVGFGRNE